MEGINYEIMKMIAEHQQMRARQKANAPKLGEKDSYGFPFEPSDCFGTTTLGFLETAMKMQTQALETFRMLTNINRHSPLFYKMSSELEKLIGQLGSVCITQAVIEQREGQTFPTLEKLTIEWLREKVAFNFRKCYASYMESMSYVRFNQTALSLSTRWAALDRRLLATQEKIEKIKAGLIKVDVSEIKDTAKAPADPEAEQNSREKKDTALPTEGRALSVDKAAVREWDQQKPTETVSATEETDIQKEDTSELPVEAEPNPEIPEECKAADPAFDEPDMEEAQPAEEITLKENDSEELPSVSEELVRQMSEYLTQQEFLKWAYPEYQYAQPTAPP